MDVFQLDLVLRVINKALSFHYKTSHETCGLGITQETSKSLKSSLRKKQVEWKKPRKTFPCSCVHLTPINAWHKRQLFASLFVLTTTLEVRKYFTGQIHNLAKLLRIKGVIR